MKTLKDVYIYVDKRNHEKTAELLQSEHLPYGCIYFNFDDIKSWSIRERKAEKVSLSQLKRLIDTIPTREEITRLKRQISAYKMNYDKVVKHSLSKEDVIEDLQRKLNRERSTTTDLFKQRKEVQLNHCKQIHTLSEEVERVKNTNEHRNVLNTNLTTENNNLRRINKELQKENDKLKQENRGLYNLYLDLENVTDKEINDLKNENAQLKNKKWWQIWK